MQHSIAQNDSSSATKLTRALLFCGVVAGPLYVIVGAIEMLTRPGFDVTRHDLSLMSNGDWGWVHSSLLILTGLLTCAQVGCGGSCVGAEAEPGDHSSLASTGWG